MLEGAHLVIEAVLLRPGGNEALQEMIAADHAEVLRLGRSRALLHAAQQGGDERRIDGHVGQ